MDIWINKCKDDLRVNKDEKILVFNLNNKNNKSNIKTDLEKLWRSFGIKTISNINEDLIIIALSIFAVDKRISRSLFLDGWTREINISIPVIEIEKLNNVKMDLERMLGFLSGDKWNISFRKTTEKFRGNKVNTHNVITNNDFDCVSLFSGGLDSFSGAIKLLEQNKKTFFVGFKEYGLLEKRQIKIYDILNNYYKNSNKEILLFNGTPYAPFINNIKKSNIKPENTSRSRSFLFLTGALAVASIIGKDIPVYIPENGFIGLNVSLTQSRKGTCSTRTTHPYFLKELNKILKKIGIRNKVENFYAFKTKGEIVEEVSKTKAFEVGAKETISCSHPCLSRYDKIAPPLNCGYCYPCLIRRASMNKIKYYSEEYNNNYDINKGFIDEYNRLEGKASDLKALLWSMNRYLSIRDRKEIRKLVLKTGSLDINEIEKFVDVYIKSMQELKEMIDYKNNKYDKQIEEYMGI